MSVEENTMMAKAAKYDKLMTELKAKVECPVCLTVPTGGQMLACPNGHLVCSPCRVKMTADGKEDCPVCLTVPTGGQMLACPRGHLVCGPCRVKMTAEGQEECPVCREPMGKNKSLLAMVVIENMEHDCTNTGCNEKLAYEEVTKHREELCKFRIILCPGDEREELLPLSSFDEHAKTCSESELGTSQSQVFDLDKKEYDKGNTSWTTRIFCVKNETFPLRVSMRKNNFYVETVMMAERDKCDRFMTTISIRNKLQSAANGFKGQFNPRPVGPTNMEESTLVIHKKSLAKIFTTNAQDEFEFTIDFKVSEKRAFDA